MRGEVCTHLPPPPPPPLPPSSGPGCPQPFRDDLAQSRGSAGGRGELLHYIKPAQTQLWSATAKSIVLRPDGPQPGEASNMGDSLYFSSFIALWAGTDMSITDVV